MKNTKYNYKPKTKRKMETKVFNFKNMSNQEFVSFYVMFLNGADWNNPEDISIYEAAEAELPNRNDSVKKDVAYLKEVL